MDAHSMHTFRSLRSILRALLLCSATCAILALVAPSAQAQGTRGDFALSERVSEELTKLQPLVDAKNWDGAVGLVSRLNASAPANSYDQAFLSDLLAKLHLQKGEYAQALVPLETALRLADTYGYFEKRNTDIMLDYLSKIYYQEGTSTKSPALQQQYLTKATMYLERIIKESPAPSADTMLFYTSLLYNRAVLDQTKIDQNLLKQAKANAEKSLLLSNHPKENFYVILLATLQQQGDFAPAAEYYELLVKKYPSNKNYWSQLMATYVTLSQDPDEKKARSYNLRAAVTIERAQERGFLNTPKDNFNLIGIYFNMGQYGKATELLHQGLRTGGIENTQKNWELLAYSFQQVNREKEAIEALTEATQLYPKSGQLEFQIGQIYYGMDQLPDAYRHIKLAVERGNLDKPASVHSFLAYLCYELGKLEEALDCIKTALSLPDAPTDGQLKRLRQAVEEGIRDREAAKNGTRTT